MAVAEQARITAEAASRAKSTFLANMSHELRTPLNVILGYSDTLYEEASDMGCRDILSYVDNIKVAGGKLLGIISDILDISQIETNMIKLNLSEFAVNQLVEEVVLSFKPVIRAVGHEFAVHYENELGVMCTDYQKVKQILANLLDNAAKFTTKGIITFTIDREAFKNKQMDKLIFQVTDTGIGIVSEQLDKIFKAFNQVDNSSTRQYGGTGLGLAICWHFCRIMGGNITVESKPGTGSTFRVELPAWIT